jgi:hypothetical protein
MLVETLSNLRIWVIFVVLRLMNKGHLPVKGHLQASILLIRFSLPAFTVFLGSSTFCHVPWLHPGRKLPLLLRRVASRCTE